MSHILTPEAFRNAHPELASRAWIEERGDTRFICYPCFGRVERIHLDVPLCEGCDAAACDCDEPYADVHGDPLQANRRAA